ncbi:MAG: hypothetical protein QF598_00220 [Arenicellales bacterium]|jgi:hypothetical protein|nr:hypothetical protein [Arenicellales bacterium]|tara:strand:+ start:312 stop:953 length:642 start_codon:yes stop_codon:yes gene_type:complete
MRLIYTVIVRGLLVVVSAVFLVLSANAEQFYVGNTVYNVCMKLPLLETPDRDAAVIGVMGYGDSAHVASVHGRYELPASDPSSEASQRARLPDRNEDDLLLETLFRRVRWAGLTGKGYASASCLVKQELFPKQQPGLAQEKVAKLSSKVGKRGFSEEEEGDLVAMRGAAGKAKKKPVAQNQISNAGYLEAFFIAYKSQDNTEFRRQGGLGEFK